MSGDRDSLEIPRALHLVPPSRSCVEAPSFRDAMAGMATTACPVTAEHDGDRLGRTVTSVLSLSADPPAILVSIAIASRLV